MPAVVNRSSAMVTTQVHSDPVNPSKSSAPAVRLSVLLPMVFVILLMKVEPVELFFFDIILNTLAVGLRGVLGLPDRSFTLLPFPVRLLTFPDRELLMLPVLLKERPELRSLSRRMLW